MAIVFKQSKKIQKILFWNITAGMLLILFVISLVVFPPYFKSGPKIIFEGATPKPDIRINFSIIDSERVRDLEPFSGIMTEFIYIVREKSGRQLSGKILAKNQEEAEILLIESGLEILNLEERTSLGKSQPFVPYY